MTITGPAPVQPLPLTLGTAQFGQAYGVANRVGAVTEATAHDLVEAAWEGGIREFDTASGYGDSELVLGRALHGLGLAGQATVITKVVHLEPAELEDPQTATARITASVEGSRQRLGLDTLPLVLFHRDADARYLDVLLGLADRGWIDRVGVSCGHEPGAAVALAGRPGVAALQLPANVLDDRHRAGGSFDAASDHGVRVHVRSVFLQGLLVMPLNAVPGHLAQVLPARRWLDEVAGEAGMTTAELVLRAMLSLPGRISLLVGAETADQVRVNCRLAAGGPLPDDLVALLGSRLPGVPEPILTPGMWPQLQPSTMPVTT